MRRRIALLQGLLVAGVTAVAAVVTVYVLREADGPTPGVSAQSAEPDPGTPGDGAALREQLLHGSAEKLGITPVGSVWGVLMERGYAKGVATFVALTDGTASMYVSKGGGSVVGRAYPPARLAALKLCAQASEALAGTIPADKFPTPAKGRVRFYVLSTAGVRTAEIDAVTTLADAGTGALVALLAAGDELVDGLRDATSKGAVR